MDSTVAKTSTVTVLVAGLALLALAFVHKAQELNYKGTLVVAAGNPEYFDLATRYQADLKTYGVDVEIRRTMEGFATLRALADNNSGVNVGFVKGGLVGSLQGRLANEKRRAAMRSISKLRSVGRLFYEPVWVFTRGDLPITTLRDLKGKRILIGTREQRLTPHCSARCCAPTASSTRRPPPDGRGPPADAGPLVNGAADAAILVLAADTDKIQELLRVPDIRLMDFTQEADAYANRFPALTKVVLRQGAVEFDPLIPTDDITLLSTTRGPGDAAGHAAGARDRLLTSAVVNNPKSGLRQERRPGAVLPRRRVSHPPAIRSSRSRNDARIVYKTGELPFMLRLLAPIANSWACRSLHGFHQRRTRPSWWLLMPLLAVMLPLTRAMPAVYVWTVRRRLVYWYRQLKVLERRLDSGGVRYDPGALQAEIERIDGSVRRIRVPHLLSPTSSMICAATSSSSGSAWRCGRWRRRAWRRNSRQERSHQSPREVGDRLR